MESDFICNDNNKFTVVIPTYNSANTILDTLHSLLDQSERNISIIILDNGSTDNTALLVNSINDHRIRYLYFEHTSNLGASLNRAFDLDINTDFFSICHADDIYHHTYIESMINFLTENSHIDIAFSAAEIINTCGQSVNSIYNMIKKISYSFSNKYSGNLGAIRILFWNNLIAPSASFRANPAIKYKLFSTRLTYFTDVQFWINHILSGGNIGVLNKVLISYRIHDTQASNIYRNTNLQFAEYDLLLSNIVNDFDSKRKCLIFVGFLSKMFRKIKYL